MASDVSRKAPRKPQFLKVLFKDFMDKMPIPAKFVRRYLAAEPGLRRATLVSPLGKFWHVDVARDGGDVYFAGGWAEFVRANRLEEESFLVLRYEGNMVFTVKVFETSGCMRDYGNGDDDDGVATPAGAPGADGNDRGSPMPVLNAHKSRKTCLKKLLCDDDDDGGGGDDYIIQQRKKQCSSRSHHRNLGEEEKGNDDGQLQDANPNKRTEAEKHSEPTAGGAAVARESSSGRRHTGALPVYAKTATPCNLRYSYMNIGKKFCTVNGLETNRLMILRDAEGRSWPVKLTLTSDQARMKAGWAHFSSHHGIRVGDLCVFHLVDHHTFDVTIRRRAPPATPPPTTATC